MSERGNGRDITVNDSFLRHENARPPKSSFIAVDLSTSTFEDVNLRGAMFLDVALSGATFRKVDFADASIAEANLEGMRINGVLVSDLFRAYSQLNPR